MAILKCKMCGGELNLTEGASTAVCEYCGSVQTIPQMDDEKKLIQFERAERLRKQCEFDKAAGIYETIVADFRQESEAYWGLVLCKYGIEYVDDPATGKKIPTCHRLSYDSILEDSDFEQAVENADAVAAKVYREEAKQFERIRKDILAVSSDEKPYDIFICYKETDENGDRTIDSVHAQDLYSALTDKGYRVFFSRVTLQGKLGEAYEPYIFAALHSAKVMLAIGTCYEYFNAVWVKNEWSRYLKICAKDKSKHLIPCYKNLDPEDMPKEFRALQGADLGKMGAVQDILFNMEKYIPLQKPKTIVQERVVVGGSGVNKIASLLDRGNMALEDADWAKADSFFEDVLNNDSKNAQAYIGKTLAMEKCRTIDAFARKRKEASQGASAETLHMNPDNAHIEAMAEKCSVAGYVTPDQIRKLYDFDLSYRSELSSRRKQYEQEEYFWANHKQLSRAEQFAAGDVANNLLNEKKALFSALADRIKKAEESDAKSRQALQERYKAHLAKADEKAAALHADGIAKRENDYEQWGNIARDSDDEQLLTQTAEKLDNLGDFQKCKALAEQCRKRAAEEQAKIDAENEAKRKAEEAKRKAQQAKNKKIAVIAASLAAVTAVFVILLTNVIIPNSNYSKAVELMNAGSYTEAIAAFEAMNGYKDSAEKINECNSLILDEKYSEPYNNAVALMQAGNYTEAITAFEAMGGYKDSAEKINECNSLILDEKYSEPYNSAVALMQAGNYTEAIVAFEAMSGYKDSATKISECNMMILDNDYLAAVALLEKGETTKSAMAFGALGDYKDAREKSFSLWEEITERSTISAGWSHTVSLKSDGAVVAAGSNSNGRCNVSDWTDIVAISAGYYHTVGLKSDGTVMAIGKNDKGQCNVNDWTDIVAISAGNEHTVGLKSDGTVVAVGYNKFDQCNVTSWTDVVAISAGYLHTVGLKSDGTVVVVGRDEEGQGNVAGWTDIVAISVGEGYTVGLKSDGTVVAVGYTSNGKCNVSDWTDIVAISAGGHTVGLKSDGSVVAVGYNNYGQCDVSGWTDIVAISAGDYHTVGIKSDGTIVAVGDNSSGQCDVSSWTNIKLPQ